jgi:hypothetical protein
MSRIRKLLISVLVAVLALCLTAPAAVAQDPFEGCETVTFRGTDASGNLSYQCITSTTATMEMGIITSYDVNNAYTTTEQETVTESCTTGNKKEKEGTQEVTYQVTYRHTPYTTYQPVYEGVAGRFLVLAPDGQTVIGNTEFFFPQREISRTVLDEGEAVVEVNRALVSSGKCEKLKDKTTA